MFLTVGTRLGPYEILSAIGAGGMGEVYRARDSKLDRDVAIKILPELFAADPERVARFTREAKTLAALNHPHIAQIYGLEESPSTLSAGAGQAVSGQDPISALVMELIEGPTLADRIAHGPVPLNEALPIARQIAEALEAAHELGIIHRDLKPANIKVRDDGTVKVLDFGLAKALDPAASGADAAMLTNSPTITSPAAMPRLRQGYGEAGTMPGVILGTAAYMAPEQARGKAVDKRADIWAFGCVLFEMLTGRRAFLGDDVSDTLASVLKSDPEWTALPSETPTAIRKLLRRCLEKDRKRRLDSIADARLEIEDALGGATEQPTVASPSRAIRRERIVWAAAVTVLVVALVALGRFAYLNRAPTPADAPELRLQVVTPGGSLTSFALSPDARTLVYQATSDGRTQLWLRPLDSETAQPLLGTDGATLPFWSPDSRSVAFFAEQQLKRIDIASGLVQALAVAPSGWGGAWSREGFILFSPATVGPLWRVPASGGTAVEATHIDALRQSDHRFPSFLPDGRHFLFYAGGTPQTRGSYVGSIDSTDTRRLFSEYSALEFWPPDRMLFARQGVLMVQRLDLATLSPIGDAVAVAGRVARDQGRSGALHALSASLTGPVAYRASAEERQLVWLDRSGRQIGTLGGPDAAQPSNIRLSPDGRTVGLYRTVAGNTDAWLLETARGILRRFTTDPAVDYNPIWSPNGSRTVFSSTRRQGVLDLYEKLVAGDATETLLLASSEHKNARDWSPDGRFILYVNQSAKTGTDLWALALDGDRKPVPVAQTPFSETGGRFSPDGRWIAYTSNESGRVEVYVQPFPGPGGKSQISTAGGTNPAWRRDGRELFYVANGRLMAVPVTLSGPRVDVGRPVALFAVPPEASQYDAAADGQRFLFDTVVKEASPITVLLNWKSELKK